MSSRILSDWINSYMRFTLNSEPPDLFKEWTAVSVIASVLQRKCVLNWGSLTFYPNMYIVLVAPSGKCRKGTAMAPGYKLLTDIGIKVAAESITREALIRELDECKASHGNPESGKIFLHSSLTIFSQELAVFLGSNNLALVRDLTDWFDCRERWTYRTKNCGINEIVGVWINLFGATTPELIQTSLSQEIFGGGLASRIIFVYEERKSKIVPAPFISPEEEQLREQLKLDLEAINMLVGDFHITDGFIDLWTEWYCAQEDKPPFKSPKFEGYFERRPTHIQKLAMIMSASRTSDMIITRGDLARAIDLLNRTEVKMPKTFSGVGRNTTADVVSNIMRILAIEEEVSFADLLRRFYHDTDKDTLEKVVATLEGMNFCKVVTRGGSDRYVVRIPPPANDQTDLH